MTLPVQVLLSCIAIFGMFLLHWVLDIPTPPPYLKEHMSNSPSKSPSNRYLTVYLYFVSAVMQMGDGETHFDDIIQTPIRITTKAELDTLRRQLVSRVKVSSTDGVPVLGMTPALVLQTLQPLGTVQVDRAALQEKLNAQVLAAAGIRKGDPTDAPATPDPANPAVPAAAPRVPAADDPAGDGAAQVAGSGASGVP